MLTKLKKQVQTALTSSANVLHNMGLTPNRVSIVGITLSLLAGVVYSQWHINRAFLILAPILMLISGLFDALDGVIARVHGEATIFGAFFDSMLDRYADAIVLCGIIAGGLTNIAWGLAALVGSMMVSYARARAEAAGIKMESVGLAERAERIVLIGFASIISYFWIDALNWSILLLAVLTNFTVLQRANYFHKLTK
ncbi:MAG: archaetidylinositol phosphate synthase [Candidatus Bathyarchaeota archaeon]|nr:archaetidylinositol phosphate synthase [Candidatus Bathyarchaeum sp.]